MANNVKFCNLIVVNNDGYPTLVNGMNLPSEQLENGEGSQLDEMIDYALEVGEINEDTIKSIIEGLSKRLSK